MSIIADLQRLRDSRVSKQRKLLNAAEVRPLSDEALRALKDINGEVEDLNKITVRYPGSKRPQ
jgi:hypothetical protein